MTNFIPAIEAFSPEALHAWSQALGQPTFVDSSGRVFPKRMKASPFLRAWLRRPDFMGVKFAFRHRWSGWDEDGPLLFQTADGPRVVDARATVLALGRRQLAVARLRRGVGRNTRREGSFDIAAQAGQLRI